MHRFQEISVLTDHSQIPVVLARNTSTRELLALQRIPVCLQKEDEEEQERQQQQQTQKSKPQLLPLRTLLERFPWIKHWSEVPRHPGLLMLREVIVENLELFLVSERYSETLVRYLRRQGVVARRQVLQHALNTVSDHKHDRAAGALLERWIAEDCVPDERNVELWDGLGLALSLHQQQQYHRANNNNNNNNNKTTTSSASSAAFGSDSLLNTSATGGQLPSSRFGTQKQQQQQPQQHPPQHDLATRDGGVVQKRRRSMIAPLARHHSNTKPMSTATSAGGGGGGTGTGTGTGGAVIDAAYGAAIHRKISNLDVTQFSSASSILNKSDDIFDPHGALAGSDFVGGMIGGQGVTEYSSVAVVEAGEGESSSSSDEAEFEEEQEDSIDAMIRQDERNIEDEISTSMVAAGDTAALAFIRNTPNARAAAVEAESRNSQLRKRKGSVSQRRKSQQQHPMNQQQPPRSAAYPHAPIATAQLPHHHHHYSSGAFDSAPHDVVPDHHPAVRFADIYRVPITDAEVRLILFQLLAALQKLHEGGAAHGNVAPKNLVLAQRGNLCTLRLSNFRNLRKLDAAPGAAAAAGVSCLSEEGNIDGVNPPLSSQQQQQQRQFDASKIATGSKRGSTTTSAATTTADAATLEQRNLSKIIADAIQASLTEIQQEEEWRKRRQSLFVPTKQQQQHPQQPLGRTKEVASVTGSCGASLAAAGVGGDYGDSGRLGATPTVLSLPSPTATTTTMTTTTATATAARGEHKKSGFDHFRRHGSRPLSPNSSKNVNAAIGVEVMSSWNNDDDEAVLAQNLLTSMMKEKAETEAACYGGNSAPAVAAADDDAADPARFYNKRDDVKRWVETFYAAPEVILDYLPHATPAGDIWSAALIALELYSARPLVYGTTARDCFFRAAGICGCPSSVQSVEFHRWALHVTRAQLPELGIRATPLRSVAPLASDVAVDLLSRMLVLDPSQRLTAAEALKHPFFTM